MVRSYSAFDYGPIALESNQRQCVECEAYLSDSADERFDIRNQFGQSIDYCLECLAPIIGPAVDAIFSIFELAPEEDERVYSPFMWAAQ